MFFIVNIVQAFKAWPYTMFGHKQVLESEGEATDTTSISMLICNVLQTNTKYGSVLEKIDQYNPDILITTESDSLWEKNLYVLNTRYPYRIPIPLSNTYGMHLYSRLPLSETKVRFLVEPDIPSIRTRVQLPSGARITMFVVHPRPPVPTEASDSRERDAEIIMVAREARKEKGGVIVAGDFNDVAWSETTELFQEVSGFLDPRRGRGFYNTFHADIPLFRWPLDHIFHSSHFKLVKMKRVGRVNSDHFPMFIKLSYEPGEKRDQPKVKPDEKTEREASEAIRKGKTDKDAPGQ
jgi:endonuclease/exonuclease/phosphatase (EEP) superfamily protein YafD